MTRYMLPVALSPRPKYRASLPNESGCVKGHRGASPVKSRICVIGNRIRPTWLTISAVVIFTGMTKRSRMPPKSVLCKEGTFPSSSRVQRPSRTGAQGLSAHPE